MFVWGRKDGGPESKVSMYGVEFKSLFSVLLLRFELGSREAFHSHAFNSWSVVLSGGLNEHFPDEKNPNGLWHFPLQSIVKTYRDTVHKVYGWNRTNWVLSLRGPWVKNWFEIQNNERTDLTVGRKKV